MQHDSEHTSRPTMNPSPDEPSDARSTEARDRYELSIDVDSDSTHARVVQLVGTDRRVLELGPATGHMTRVLRDRGCTVVGIEVDPEMANQAAEFAERVIVGNLDELDLDEELGSDRFDVIVAADVLEHLTDPLSALRRLTRFLAPEGCFVISLPNIAHGSVRIALLQGHFNYRNVGLMDVTHLRFFTRESIDDLLDEADLAVAQVFHQQLDINASEVPFDRERVPADVLEQLAEDPDARTYQFVLKAIALDTPGLRELQRHMRELAHKSAAHETTERGSAEREAQLRAALVAAHDQMLRRDAEILRLQDAVKAAQDEAAMQSSNAARLRVRLERINNLPPFRIYSMLTSLPAFKSIRAARLEGYNRALRRAGHSDSSGS
jgi:2-polyprenyl-3-methyl-5-hydroxy-6-metoxy-1,4-benzoquinol methylase